LGKNDAAILGVRKIVHISTLKGEVVVVYCDKSPKNRLFEENSQIYLSYKCNSRLSHLFQMLRLLLTFYITLSMCQLMTPYFILSFMAGIEFIGGSVGEKTLC